ncbi:hypothetical protein PoB_006329700 [Plakobranchus ocellatus]|uniref:Uncharacterized protein n=1 Tax=Plakobranchus ocellatus TaxID=259542 RepID=A0AAV4CY17_9GAST|nr:hypothetical protein PoB_006329700 [Plakobranchus ocellatus]
MASPQQDDVRFSGPPSGQGAGGAARFRNRRVSEDIRADSLATEPPMPLIWHIKKIQKRYINLRADRIFYEKKKAIRGPRKSIIVAPNTFLVGLAVNFVSCSRLKISFSLFMRSSQIGVWTNKSTT